MAVYIYLYAGRTKPANIRLIDPTSLLRLCPLTEPMSMGDSLASASAFLRSIADDTSAIGDTSASVGTFLRAMADALALGDAAARTSAFGRSISDAMAPGDRILTVAAYERAFADLVALAAQAGGYTGKEFRHLVIDGALVAVLGPVRTVTVTPHIRTVLITQHVRTVAIST